MAPVSAGDACSAQPRPVTPEPGASQSDAVISLPASVRESVQYSRSCTHSLASCDVSSLFVQHSLASCDVSSLFVQPSMHHPFARVRGFAHVRGRWLWNRNCATRRASACGRRGRTQVGGNIGNRPAARARQDLGRRSRCRYSPPPSVMWIVV